MSCVDEMVVVCMEASEVAVHGGGHGSERTREVREGQRASGGLPPAAPLSLTSLGLHGDKTTQRNYQREESK